MIDGDTFTFKFKKSGTDKDQGITGKDDKKWYAGGKLISADKDDKIKVVKIGKDANGNEIPVASMTLSEFVTNKDGLGIAMEPHTVTKDEKQNRLVTKAGEDDTVYELDGKYTNLNIAGYEVVNTSGQVVKSGTKKDGDGIKVYISGNQIQEIYVEE